MKKIATLLVCYLLQNTISFAQTDTTKSPWKHTIVSGLNLSQVAYKDWTQGGENSLAWTVSIDGKSEQEHEKTLWTNNYKFAFGQTKIGNQEIRKTEDKIDLESVFIYKMGTYINPYVAATLKTQFAKGYDYSATPTKEVSQFFDPAYLTQSAGLGYQPFAELKTRLGLGVREIITSQFTSYADDPATLKVEKTKVEGGIESVTNLELKLDDNILFTSKLELFDAFSKLDEVIVRSDNTFAAKVSKYIVVNLNIQLINERASSPRTQIKESLSLGLSYTLL